MTVAGLGLAVVVLRIIVAALGLAVWSVAGGYDE
jgi:hypothetical protein